VTRNHDALHVLSQEWDLPVIEQGTRPNRYLTLMTDKGRTAQWRELSDLLIVTIPTGLDDTKQTFVFGPELTTPTRQEWLTRWLTEASGQ
jgi:hypothetical protein